MVRKIRLKFVTITLSLLTVTFTVISLTNYMYNFYLYKEDAYYFLEMVTEDDTLINFDYFEDMTLPKVYVATINKKGTVTDIKSNIKYDSKNVEKIAKNIYKLSQKHGKLKPYLYYKRIDSKGNTIIAVEDYYTHHRELHKTAITIFIVLTAYGILLCISLFLSKYVTKPAAEALEREKQFISDASHELKTPVAAIILNAQAMSATEKQSKHLQIIISEAERMSRLIKRLLTLAYADEYNSTRDKAQFSLSDCCEEMALPFESTAFENHISYNYNIRENIQFNGIEEDIKQVVSILLDNAFKYTPNGGVVTVTLDMQGHKPVLIVKNTGDGISPEELPHIFERFYRRDKSRNNELNSFGLGLAIAHSIVKAHNGSIKVNSHYGSFTEFTVTF